MGRSFSLRDAAAFVFFAWVLWALLPHPARAQGVAATVPAGNELRAIAPKPLKAMEIAAPVAWE